MRALLPGELELLTNSWQEGQSGVIDLKSIESNAERTDEDGDVCDDPEIVKLMVQYFYHFDYSPTADPVSAPASSTEIAATITKTKPIRDRGNIMTPLTNMRPRPIFEARQSAIFPPSVTPRSQVHIVEHAKVFAMAVKYQVNGLRDLATLKFKQSAMTDWDHDNFAYAIPIVYKSTPEDIPQLREIVADTIHEHFDVLKDKATIEAVVCNIPHLAYDLLKRDEARTSCSYGHRQKFFVVACLCCEYQVDACKACKSYGRFTYCSSCGEEMR